MLAELRDFLLLTDAGWWVGTGLIIGGILALFVFAWRNLGEVGSGPLPRKLADPPPRWVPLPRVDSDTGVVPRIPGATPDVVQEQAGPEERTEETVQLPPVAGLAPQFAALHRFFKTVGETRADTNKAMGRIVDDLAGRADDCPLTTQEIPPLLDAPDYDTTVRRRADTQDLSALMEKVTKP